MVRISPHAGSTRRAVVRGGIARLRATTGAARRLARRWVPRRWRLRLAVARRWWHDRGVRFAAGRDGANGWPHEIASYRLPVHDYPGQARFAADKRHNLRVMGAALDGTLLAPGETWSLWRLAGEPTARRGYRPGAALVGGRLVSEVGGSTCLLSTVVYNAALLGDLRIEERHCHSVDTYGDERYYLLGRDATIEYAYRDLRFSNPHPWPVRLSVALDGAGVTATLRSPRPLASRVQLLVTAPVRRGELMTVGTTRRRGVDGAWVDEDLGRSVYRVAPQQLAASAE